MVLGVVSCSKDWFDVKTDKQLSIPTTLKDLQALMDNSFELNNNCPFMGENASDLHYFSIDAISAMSGFTLNSYIWAKQQPNLKVPDWMSELNPGGGSYRKVYYTNIVLKGLEKLSNDDDQELSNVKGQALFFRGKAFYELAQIFVPVYSTSDGDTNLGIPLRLDPDINISSKRSTIKQTYEQVISDLTEAVNLLRYANV